MPGTPIQISRNLLGMVLSLLGMVFSPDASRPSPLLEHMVRLHRAAEMIAEDQAEQQQQEAIVARAAGELERYRR